MHESGATQRTHVLGQLRADSVKLGGAQLNVSMPQLGSKIEHLLLAHQLVAERHLANLFVTLARLTERYGARREPITAGHKLVGRIHSLLEVYTVALVQMTLVEHLRFVQRLFHLPNAFLRASRFGVRVLHHHLVLQT